MTQPAQFITEDLSNTDRNERSCQHVDWIDGLDALSRTILSAPPLESVFKQLVTSAERVAAVHAITLRVRNPATGYLDASLCKNLNRTEWQSTVPRGGIGLSKAVVENRAPAMIQDIQRSPSTRNAGILIEHGLNSYLGVPLMVGGQVTGVVGYYSRNDQGFYSDEIQYLTALVHVAAVITHSTVMSDENTKEQQLRSSPATADKSEKAKAEFLGVMSHELRTPLNLIMGYAGLMQEGILGELNAEQRSSLQRIIQCSDNLLAMVISILEASTIETDAIRLHNELCDPRELLEELKTSVTVPPEKSLDLTWNWTPDLPNIKTDREKLKRVLEHLIDNAIKFSEMGQVLISVDWDPPAQIIRFTIADTGVGIPTELLPFLFEKFRQSDSSMTRAHGGVGLGLYIAKKFTDFLGGELKAKSQVDKGSVFTVSLPVGI